MQKPEQRWGVFHCRCLKCGYRFTTVADFETHDNIPFWECANCFEWSLTHYYAHDDIYVENLAAE